MTPEQLDQITGPATVRRECALCERIVGPYVSEVYAAVAMETHMLYRHNIYPKRKKRQQ